MKPEDGEINEEGKRGKVKEIVGKRNEVRKKERYSAMLLYEVILIQVTSPETNTEGNFFIVAPCVSYSHLISTPTDAHIYQFFYIKKYIIAPNMFRS